MQPNQPTEKTNLLFVKTATSTNPQEKLEKMMLAIVSCFQREWSMQLDGASRGLKKPKLKCLSINGVRLCGGTFYESL